MSDAVEAFLLFFGSLFPIVNPPGSAFLFLASTRRLEPSLRSRLARRVAFYSLLIICGSQYLGAHILSLFGVSIYALRMGGGLVLAVAGYRMLNDRGDETPPEIAQATGNAKTDIAFYPLTIPLTVGPGSIAVTIALGSGHAGAGGAASLGGLLAAVTIAATIYVCYRSAERMQSLLGQTLADALTRLFALILLCVGIEIMMKGLVEGLSTLGISIK